MKKTISNFFYQVVYQLIKILIPIITIPIASKALGANGIGLNSFSNSIVQYFVLISSLGITFYGNREIAINKDLGKLKQSFIDIFIMKLIMCVISLFIFFMMILIFFQNNKLIFSIQSIYIFAIIFDVSWFFMGIEDFKKTSLSSFLCQVVGFIFIVAFVKEPKDVYIYALILALSNIFSQILPLFFIKKSLDSISKNEIYKFEIKNISLHLKGAFVYFIPQIGIVLYSTINKTLLGFFVDYDSVGYYTNSMNLISAIITVITTIDLVMLPKMTSMFSKNKANEVDKYVSISLGFEMYIAIPCLVGLVSLSRVFVPWFFGNDFLQLIYILPVESLLLIIVPIGVSISRQYLIPMGKTKDYTMSIFIGAGINIILSVLLINIVGVYGAIFSNIASELFVTLYRINWSIKNTKLSVGQLNILKIWVASIIMGIVIYSISNIIKINTIGILFLVIVGVFIYIFVGILLKINEIGIIKKIAKRR